MQHEPAVPQGPAAVLRITQKIPIRGQRGFIKVIPRCQRLRFDGRQALVARQVELNLRRVPGDEARRQRGIRQERFAAKRVFREEREAVGLGVRRERGVQRKPLGLEPRSPPARYSVTTPQPRALELVVQLQNIPQPSALILRTHTLWHTHVGPKGPYELIR